MEDRDAGVGAIDDGLLIPGHVGVGDVLAVGVGDSLVEGEAIAAVILVDEQAGAHVRHEPVAFLGHKACDGAGLSRVVVDALELAAIIPVHCILVQCREADNQVDPTSRPHSLSVHPEDFGSSIGGNGSIDIELCPSMGVDRAICACGANSHDRHIIIEGNCPTDSVDGLIDER